MEQLSPDKIEALLSAGGLEQAIEQVLSMVKGWEPDAQGEALEMLSRACDMSLPNRPEAWEQWVTELRASREVWSDKEGVSSRRLLPPEPRMLENIISLAAEDEDSELAGPAASQNRPDSTRDIAPASRRSRRDKGAVRAFEKGEVLGGFQLLERLGRGGMGEVYLANQMSLDRRVALKILPMWLADDLDFVARFRREARTAAKLAHPNIVAAIDVGQAGSEYFFAMEYVSGDTVSEIMAREGKLGEKRAIDIILQASKGLQCAWQNGLIHRDVKPENIMISDDGVVKLADLGLARESDRTVTRITDTGAMMGTPQYVSPEQATGAKLDIRSDIYSLGITFFEALTGKLPFEGEEMRTVLMAKVFTAIPLVTEHEPDLSPEVTQVVAVMTATEPDERYPNPSVLIYDLMLIAEGREPEFANPNAARRAQALIASQEPRSTTSIMQAHQAAHERRKKSGNQLVSIPTLVAIVIISAAVHLAFRMLPNAVDHSVSPNPRYETKARAAYEKVRGQFEAGEVNRAAYVLPALIDAYSDTDHHAKLVALYSQVRDRKKRLERDRREQSALEQLNQLEQMYRNGEYAALVHRIESAGEVFAGTQHAEAARQLRVQALLKRDEKVQAARSEREHQALVEAARRLLALEAYPEAIVTLTRAKAHKSSPEVIRLLRIVERGQLIAAAQRLEDRDPAKALALYQKALKISGELRLSDESSLRKHVFELKRKQEN